MKLRAHKSLTFINFFISRLYRAWFLLRFNSEKSSKSALKVSIFCQHQAFFDEFFIVAHFERRALAHSNNCKLMYLLLIIA